VGPAPVCAAPRSPRRQDASNAEVNLVSRSRIRYRNRPRSSPSCMRKFRACWNCRQVSADRTGAGATPARCRMVHTVPAPIWYPRRHSSPWMRRYPQVGFSRASRSTNPRSSAAARGRPRRCGYVQRRRTRSRCQRSRVVGWTIKPCQAGRGRSRAKPASTARSAQSTRGRATWRRSTATSWPA
jgi:hypothetical protein